MTDHWTISFELPSFWNKVQSAQRRTSCLTMEPKIVLTAYYFGAIIKSIKVWKDLRIRWFEPTSCAQLHLQCSRRTNCLFECLASATLTFQCPGQRPTAVFDASNGLSCSFRQSEFFGLMALLFWSSNLQKTWADMMCSRIWRVLEQRFICSNVSFQ